MSKTLKTILVAGAAVGTTLLVGAAVVLYGIAMVAEATEHDDEFGCYPDDYHA